MAYHRWIRFKHVMASTMENVRLTTKPIDVLKIFWSLICEPSTGTSTFFITYPESKSISSKNRCQRARSAWHAMAGELFSQTFQVNTYQLPLTIRFNFDYYRLRILHILFKSAMSTLFLFFGSVVFKYIVRFLLS